MGNHNTIAWAQEEFGSAQLGDLRRTRRLVKMAATAVTNPSGKITAMFDEEDAREGAFRLVENDDVSAAEIGRAAHIAAARRSVGQDCVLVPIDGSSLKLTDHTSEKGFGAVGKRSSGGLGLIVMSAIAVRRDGTPLGLCWQQYWARRQRSTCKNEKKDQRHLKEKETRYWLQAMEYVKQLFAEHAPETTPWYQMDRGGDAWSVLLAGGMSGAWVTVRATHNRRLAGPSDKRRYLWDEVERQPVRTIYELEIPDGPKRTARTARLGVQFSPVRLELRDLHSKRRHEAQYFAVLVREVGTTPANEKPIEWMLLTTYPVHTVEDALVVVDAYSKRWRIEEFHKVWKTGACRVEDAQLRAEDHVVRWATILASVAMRLLRLTYLARTAPAAPATDELSLAEVQAIVLVRKSKRKRVATRRNGIPCIADAVQWLAELGGYTGKSSGGPPGALVIARGLRRIETLAYVIARRCLCPRVPDGGIRWAAIERHDTGGRSSSSRWSRSSGLSTAYLS